MKRQKSSLQLTKFRLRIRVYASLDDVNFDLTSKYGCWDKENVRFSFENFQRITNQTVAADALQNKLNFLTEIKDRYNFFYNCGFG